MILNFIQKVKFSLRSKLYIYMYIFIHTHIHIIYYVYICIYYIYTHRLELVILLMFACTGNIGDTDIYTSHGWMVKRG